MKRQLHIFIAPTLALFLVGCAGTLPKYDGPYAVRTPADKPLMMGQVKLTTTVEPRTAVLDALEKAGGLTQAAAEQNAILYCPGEKLKRLDLHALVRGDMTQNAILNPGCHVWVPKTLRAEIGSWFGMFRGSGDAIFLLRSGD